MKYLRITLLHLAEEDSGQDLVEYALLAGLMALVSVAAMQSLTLSISTVLGTVGTLITGAFP